MKLWGGRFQQTPAAAFERFSGSFGFDRRLAAAEAAGSRAHVRGLARAGLLTRDEAEALAAACKQLEKEFSAGPPADQASVEDVHTFVFERLRQMAGEAAALKIQTGRSRNEQVALDLRLYLRAQRDPLRQRLGRMLEALAGFADAQAEVIVAGYTHLQRAQPVSLGHLALAYAEMLLRDAGRLGDAYARMDVCPLGSGALAGTPWPVAREVAARELGFGGVTQNSVDAVSDRDFACELGFTLSLLGVHLARWAEDWILYASSEFGWLQLGEGYATGSSLMPQKKNPDALELIRGKSARQIGHLTQLLTLLKGLPLAYNRDLQEDKEAIFDAVETALGCLEIASGVIATTMVDRMAAERSSSDPALLATDLADLLVSAGMPFHRAHETVGHLVRSAQEQGRDFRSLSAAELAGFAPELEEAKVKALSAAGSVARRECVGGTAVGQVRQQAARIAAEAKVLMS